MIKRFFVGNLPEEANSQDLFPLFSKHGRVVSAYVVRDKDGRSKGYGYVNMKNSRNIVSRISGKEFKGRTIRVRLDTPVFNRFKNSRRVIS